MNREALRDQLLDQLTIADLIQRERLYRDRQQWERLHALYHPDSRVHLGWFVGTGAEYVEASRRLDTHHTGWHIMHVTYPTVVQVQENRAIATTNTLIVRRTILNGVLVDITIYCQLYSRVERRDDDWKLLTLDVIYEKDTVVPVYSSDRLELNRDEIESGPPAYRFSAYNLRKLGYCVKPDELYATDQPERVAQLYHQAENWLSIG